MSLKGTMLLFSEITSEMYSQVPVVKLQIRSASISSARSFRKAEGTLNAGFAHGLVNRKEEQSDAE